MFTPLVEIKMFDNDILCRGDTLYYFEVALAPPMSNSATPMMILHPQGQGI